LNIVFAALKIAYLKALFSSFRKYLGPMRERKSAAGAVKQETSIRLRNNQNNFSSTSPAIEIDT
jgi:hypothetical protein